MSWTVIKADKHGNILQKLPEDFVLTKTDLLFNDRFKLLKYLDLYGDTVFNRLMLDDLIADFEALKVLLPIDEKQFDEILDFVNDCKMDVHNYLKFCGD